MESSIANLLHEKEHNQSRLEKMMWGSIEIREKSGNRYIYVHRRIEGIKESKYVGEYSDDFIRIIQENNILAKQYKKRIKEINKELDSINYESHELSDRVKLNIDLARKYMVDSIYKQAMLEGVATTYSDTETIVNGGKVSNMTVSDITKVVNLKRAWEFILSEGVISYSTNYPVLCQINNIVEDGFSMVAGKLRSVPVKIGGSTYIPPMPIEFVIKEQLEEIIQSNIDDLDKTIEILLFVMKKQLFLDGNKRTAVIFANHLLISKGLGLIAIPEDKVKEYKQLLIAYYEGADTESIKAFLKKECYQKI